MEPKEASGVESKLQAPATSWDIKEHDGSFAKYMEAKNHKLRIQFKENKKGVDEGTSDLFKGICIYVNGYTVPSHSELQDIMYRYGGVFENYYSTSRVTHMICSSLPDAKYKQFAKQRNPVPVVHPNWILESIRAKKVLPASQYILERLHRDPRQGKLQLGRREGVENTHCNPVDEERQVELLQDPACQVHNKSPEELQNNHPGGNSPLSENSGADFVDTFFKSSRLHFIGTWKAQMESLMAAASTISAPQPKHASSMKDKRVMHVDIDSFFASVAILENPSLKGRPIAVCHSDNARGTAEISSANYEARKFGIKAGMFMSSAKKLCPQLVRAPYHFERYHQISSQLYRILFKTSASVQPVSIDEAFLDITGIGEGLQIAQNVRSQFFKETGITVSVGISHNMLLARIATKNAKPDGKFMIPFDEAINFVKELPVCEMPGVGYHLNKKLGEHNIERCADVYLKSKQFFQQHFGNKTGEMIWDYAHGRDRRSVKQKSPRQSVGAEVNWGIRFITQKQTTDMLEKLSDEVQKRLKHSHVKGRTITLKLKRRKPNAPAPPKFMGHGLCDNISRSVTLASPTSDKERILEEVVCLLSSIDIQTTDIRGIGIQVSRLTEESGLSMKAVAKPSGDQPILDNFKKGSDPQPLNLFLDSGSPNKGGNGLREGRQHNNDEKSKRVNNHDTLIDEQVKRKRSTSRNLFSENSNVPIAVAPRRESLEDPLAAPITGEIDLSVLAELPPDMQRELRAAYGISPKKISHSSKSPPKKDKQIQLKNAQSNNNSTSNLGINHSQIDQDVLSELPSQIQREIRSVIDTSRWKGNVPHAEWKDDIVQVADDIVESPMSNMYSCLKADLDTAKYSHVVKDIIDKFIKDSQSDASQHDTSVCFEMLNRYVEDGINFNLDKIQRVFRALKVYGQDWFSEESLQQFEVKVQKLVKDFYGGQLES